MAFVSAGERIAVHAELAWVDRLVRRAIGGRADGFAPDVSPDRAATVRLRVEARAHAFPREGLRPVTRGAYSDGSRTVLIDACGSGFDLLVVVSDEELTVTARYRPPTRTRAANLALSGRFGLLAGQVLVHYPLLWRAGWRGRVPLHASVVRTSAGTPLVAGPGGVGKSTVLIGLLDAGATATADNLCCADLHDCYGVAEPMRTDARGVTGTRSSHGRVELPLAGREPVLAPDRMVVLERGPRTETEAIKPDEAARALTAGTYAAGELRRYWAFAATLGLATGLGPAHPPITEVAHDYAERLPCLRVRVGDGATVSAAQLCGENL
jgi:hypothetical protein